MIFIHSLPKWFSFCRPALEIPSAEETSSAQANPSEERAPSAHTSPARAEPRETSPPPVTASDVIILGPPVGDAEGQREHDVHMEDSSVPMEGGLGASQLGAERRHDKSPVEPEHAEP